MNHFCTITTASHLYKTYALADSLNRGKAFVLHVLLVDSSERPAFPNCQFYGINDLQFDKSAATIVEKYGNDKDKLRWCMKPVFMKMLLGEQEIDKVIYLDNDLFFYNDYEFLFDLLDKHSFLLTPHYYRNNPNREQNWFEANFRVGLYNAGFVGANKRATETLQWWADSCIYRCEKNAFRGLFDDQKYLDLVPVMDENAHVLRHKGCNIAGWNVDLCVRKKVGNEVFIEGGFPIVFIHFNDTTIREIVQGADSILLDYYRDYLAALKKRKPGLADGDLLVKIPLKDKVKYAIWKVVTDSGI